MKLSKHFTYEEFIKSKTAEKNGIINIPSKFEIVNMVHLCVNVLEPLREHFQQPIRILSGFRNLELNRKLGSKDSSQHVIGEAADIEVVAVSNMEVCEFIRDNLVFDQLIAEKLSSNDPFAGWVHVSYTFNKKNRRNTLSFNGRNYEPGLKFRG